MSDTPLTLPLAKVTDAARAALVADVTTQQATAQNVTGLSFPIPANQTWAVTLRLRTGCTSTSGSGLKLAVSGPSGSSMDGRLIGSGSSAGSLRAENGPSVGSLTGNSYNAYGGQTGFVDFDFTIASGSTAGTVQVQFAAANTADTVSVKAKSSLLAWRVA